MADFHSPRSHVLAANDEDALPAVTVGVRLQDLEQVAALDVEDDLLEPDAALRLSFAFFASSQSKYFTDIQEITMCA